jgi:geranylgeranyl pyrophosphate synthase
VADRSEKTAKRVKRLLEERGTKALETAREEILKERIECKEVKEALEYFMTEYWQDLARPTLLSVSCEAVGGDPNAISHIAVPMILISGAIDIHDDIIDQSKRKHGKPTVYGKYGRDLALLVGDALLFKGLTLLNEVPEKVSLQRMKTIVRIMKNMFFELGDAQALELEFRGRFDVTPEEYLHVVEKKAADVEAYASIGGILGGGTEEEIEALGDCGRLLGTIVILADDVEDLLDIDELKHRIHSEHLPLPLLHVLQSSKIKSHILQILSKKTLTKKDVQRISEMVYEEEKTYLSRLVGKLTRKSYSKIKRLAVGKENLQFLISNVITFPNHRKQ